MNRTIATEFPDFDLATLPAIPATWEDESWHNDTCPSFATPNGWKVFIDFANPAEREFTEAPRFTCYKPNEEIDSSLLDETSSDDWNDILVRVLSAGFAAIVRRALADELPEIIKRNRTIPAGCCATQDFTDANMLMAEAFESIIAHDVDGNSDSDCALWNRAWNMARESDFQN